MTTIVAKYVLVVFATLGGSESKGFQAVGTYESLTQCEQAGELLPPSSLLKDCVTGAVGEWWQRRARLLRR